MARRPAAREAGEESAVADDPPPFMKNVIRMVVKEVLQSTGINVVDAQMTERAPSGRTRGRDPSEDAQAQRSRRVHRGDAPKCDQPLSAYPSADDSRGPPVKGDGRRCG